MSINRLQKTNQMHLIKKHTDMIETYIYYIFKGYHIYFYFFSLVKKRNILYKNAIHVSTNVTISKD